MRFIAFKWVSNGLVHVSQRALGVQEKFLGPMKSLPIVGLKAFQYVPGAFKGHQGVSEGFRRASAPRRFNGFHGVLGGFKSFFKGVFRGVIKYFRKFQGVS